MAQDRKDVMTTVCFVRHARSIYNEQGKMAGRHDPPLSDAGVQEAEQTARHLEGAKWDAAYASPLRRARDTARIVLGPRPLEAVPDPAICELDMGDFSGRAWDDVVKNYPRDDSGQEITFWQLFSRDRIPNQEPYRAAANRITSFFGRIIADHEGQTVLVVGHKGVMEVFLSETIGFDPCVDWFEISGGSVTTFELGRGRKAKFLSVNVRPGRVLP